MRFLIGALMEINAAHFLIAMISTLFYLQFKGVPSEDRTPFPGYIVTPDASLSIIK